MTADDIIRTLALQPHPEGGHYAESWRDDPSDGSRGVGSAIYFLLRETEVSAWHRVDAAETWHFYAGAPLELRVVADGTDQSGTTQPTVWTLGPHLAAGERPQWTVPANAWQTARSLGLWTLVGCTVAPAFRFDGFELWEPGEESPLP